MDTTVIVYHSAGINLLPGGVGVNDAACSGGISESEKRLCFPDDRHYRLSCLACN